ncbi:MAG: serine/threonine-protein kinase, partial [Myxococcota bacterium]
TPDTGASGDGPALALPSVSRDRFIVQRLVGVGGMGRVLRAVDRQLSRVVAIKDVMEPQLRARFEREARITAQLQHPAIVPVYEAGAWPDGNPFYTMRLVEGSDLAHAIADRPTLAQRLELVGHVTTVVDAIAYAHERGIIHRDLKPQNILVGDHGETIVIDWGLALGDGQRDRSDSDAVADTPLTQVGAVMGTPGFMAPEQARGEPADARSDVYALGAVLYTVLAGAPPFVADPPGVSPDRLLERIASSRPAALADRVPEAPGDLVALTERAMASQPGERFPDAGAMARELRRFQAGLLLESRRYSRGELIRRWLRRHRSLVAAAAVSVIAIAAVAALSTQRILDARDRERDARRAAEATRDQAVSARRQAEAERHELVFQQARNALDRDPTATLAWLRRYPTDGPRARAAGLLVAEATRRGVSRWVLSGGRTESGDLQLRAGRLVAAPPGRLWDLTTGAATEIPGRNATLSAAHLCWSKDARLICRDARGVERAWTAARSPAAIAFESSDRATPRAAVVIGGAVYRVDLDTGSDQRLLDRRWSEPELYAAGAYFLAQNGGERGLAVVSWRGDETPWWLPSLRGPGWTRELAFSADGRRIAIANNATDAEVHILIPHERRAIALDHGWRGDQTER